jgi:hypothetical protein
MPSDGEAAQELDSAAPPKWQIAIALIVLAALTAATVLAVIQIYPHKLTTPKNPSFVDNVFDSRIVVLLIRIALIFAAGYVVISVVGLIISRRWLAELGPFKASEPIARLERGAEALEKDLADALETVEGLEHQLVENGVALTQSQSDIEFLLDQIDTIEAERKGK